MREGPGRKTDSWREKDKPGVLAGKEILARQRAVPRQGNERRLRHAELHNRTPIPRRGTFRMASRCRNPLSGHRTILSSCSEDKFIQSRPTRPADSIQLVAGSALALMLRLGAQLETVLVLIAQWSAGGGINFKGQPTGKERQHTKHDIDHGFRGATPMPCRAGNSLERALRLRTAMDLEKPPPQSAVPAELVCADKPFSELLQRGAVHFP